MNNTEFFAFAENRVVAASAGTGKTFRLAGIAVHALLGASYARGAQPSVIEPARVLATTFSRKAAAEIHERIRGELQKFVDAPQSSPYFQSVRDVLSAAALPHSDKELRARAEHALMHLDEAFVGTLHAWAYRIVQDFPIESGLGGGVRVASDAELDTLSRAAFHQMLEAAHARGERAELSRAAAAAGGVGALRGAMARVLEQLTELGIGPGDLRLPDELAALEAFEQARQDALAAARAMGDATLENNLVLLAPGMPAPEKWPNWPSQTKGASASNAAYIRLRAMLGEKTTMSLAHALLEPVRQHASAYMESAVFARRWLVDFDERLTALMASENVASFGSIVATSRRMLRDFPQVAAEVSERYDIVLLDESQDMSRAQADLVSLLWHGGARQAGELPPMREVKPRGLFVVGDRKQSIYAFRGADVRVFSEMCVEIAGEPARAAFGVDLPVPSAPTGRFLTIRPNYRSARRVLEFANAFARARFDAATDDDGEQTPGSPDVRYMPDTDDLLVPTDKAVGDGKTVAWIRVPPKTDFGPAIAAAILADLRAGTSPERIAVLAYRRADLEPVAAALAEVGISAASTARDFYGAQIVGDSLAALRVLRDATDHLSSLILLRGPIAGLLDDSLMHLASREPGTPWIACEHLSLLREHGVEADECERYYRLAEWMHAARTVVHSVNAGDLLASMFRHFELDMVLAQLPDGGEQLGNMRKLIRLAHSESSVARFVARIEAELDRNTQEEEAGSGELADNAVRLMTVHASKGLDFDHVYLAHSTRRGMSDRDSWRLDKSARNEAPVLYPKWSTDSGNYNALSAKESDRRANLRRDGEDARKAYVATTRARESMTFFGSAPEKPPGKGSLSDLSVLFAFESAGRIQILEPIANAGDPAEPAVPAVLARSSARLPVWSRMQIAPTALGDFEKCERLFALRHVWGAKPLQTGMRRPSLRPAANADAMRGSLPPTQDPAQEGVVLHRVLEHLPELEFGAPESGTIDALLAREGIGADDASLGQLRQRLMGFAGGPYARACRAEGARLHRELPFFLSVQDEKGRRLDLRGTADLVVERADGSIDVVDYKRGAGPHATTHAFQLGVYALAMKEHFPSATRVRAGVAFLAEGEGEVRFLPSESLQAQPDQLLELASRLVHARSCDQFAPEQKPHCVELRCPYLETCWPPQVDAGGG